MQQQQQQRGCCPLTGSTQTLLWLALLAGKNENYLVSSTFGVDKHKQRLHELGGERLHQEGLPAAILKPGDKADTPRFRFVQTTSADLIYYCLQEVVFPGAHLHSLLA